MPRFALFTFLLLCCAPVYGQDGAWTSFTDTPPPGKAYLTEGGEWLLTLPILDDGSGDVVRFAPLFNARYLLHYDANEHIGFFTGLSVSNLGFIHDAPNGDRYKYRTYNAGLPVGIKLGRMHGTLVALGYELEKPLNYKEKRFVNERKEDKFNVWFSERTEPWFHSVFLSAQGPAGSTLTVRYHLTTFHNTSYVERMDAGDVRPYAELGGNLLVVSVGFGLYNGKRTRWELQPPPRDTQAHRR